MAVILAIAGVALWIIGNNVKKSDQEAAGTCELTTSLNGGYDDCSTASAGTAVEAGGGIALGIGVVIGLMLAFSRPPGRDSENNEGSGTR